MVRAKAKEIEKDLEMTNSQLLNQNEDLGSTPVSQTMPTRAERIVEAAPDAFIGFDFECRIIDWNEQATAVFGLTREAAIGRPLWATILAPASYELQCRGKMRFQNCPDAPAGRHRLEVSARHRDGREFPIEIMIIGPLRSATGESYGAFVRDISKRKQREAELRKAKEAAESYSRTMETLNSISRELSALLNLEELLTRIGELLFQIVEYHSFSVMLVDSSGEKLIERFSYSGSPVTENSDVPISEGVVGFAARTRRPVLVGDVYRDSRYIKFHEDTRSELSVPLIVKERLIGVLDIEHGSPDYFRADQVHAITILAAQLAVALDNAILYERISSQERQLNRDLQFARVLQRRLLSADLPVMKNAAVSTLSWPARIIAGDIFDFAYHRESRQHVSILGDVTGKGAPAAVYAALTCGIIRTLIEREPDPTEMLKLINEALLERPLEAQFVALMYTLWDDFNLVMRIANSGLPKPVRYSNGRMEIIEAMGTPLGLLAGVEYDEQSVAAAPGDVFVFLTDGILEASDLSGKEFGYRGLETALHRSHRLGVNQIRDAIAKAVTSHCKCVEPGDDQTLIVFKVQKQNAHELRQPAENLRVRTGEFRLR